MNNENLINPTPFSPAPPQAPAPKNTKTRKILIFTIIGLISFAAGLASAYGLTKLAHNQPDNAPTPAPTAEPTDEPKTASNLNFDFLKLENSGKNLSYSPLSIKNGLALLSAGASGTTKTEIDSVLGSAKIAKYENVADKLSLANAVFVRDTFSDKVNADYANTVSSNYGAEVLYDNFASSANMDNWVKQKTFNLIDSIGIQPTDDTQMVLANALAIQLDWKHKFSDPASDRSFYLESGEEIQAKTMKKNFNADDIYYRVGDDATVVSMPLEAVAGAELEFAAIMPTGNLTDYVKNLNQETVDTALKDLSPASDAQDGVDLYIPKFKFDYTLDFQKDLEKLGIKTAFNAELADFSAMATEPLYVFAASHKANIDFSETGIKASAVTTSHMMAGLAAEEPKPVVVKVDHPFLFLIRDKANGEIWFTGTVYQPTAE